jgi:hypothetical protein
MKQLQLHTIYALGKEGCSVELTDAQYREVKALATNPLRKITAIKTLRDLLCGLGLKEAKDMIENTDNWQPREEATTPITLSIGLKQFSSKGAAQRWIDRQIARKPSLKANEFVINQVDYGCHEVEMTIFGLQLPKSGHLEIGLLGLL